MLLMFFQNSKPNDMNFYKAFQQHRSYLDTNDTSTMDPYRSKNHSTNIKRMSLQQVHFKPNFFKPPISFRRNEAKQIIL
uniref:Uncharacterized protein n=1 Tax=Meloidogyne enterolobii TaxID=390850 RepID=A0A6V7UL57_MELEN|nr:unnamed protein product [Meloidogyne enterolobii]